MISSKTEHYRKELPKNNIKIAYSYLLKAKF